MSNSTAQQRLHALGQFSSALSVSSGDDISAAGYAQLLDFVAAAYAEAWVLAGFDWQAWAETAEAEQLLSEPSAIAEANSEQLAQVLTLVIKNDRINQGSLEDAYEQGLLGDCAQRAAALATEAE